MSDTARWSATTSFTADSEVPPSSKKESCLLIRSGVVPRTAAQASASRCSVAVRASVGVSSSGGTPSCAMRLKAFRSIFPLPVSGRLSCHRYTDGSM